MFKMVHGYIRKDGSNMNVRVETLGQLSQRVGISHRQLRHLAGRLGHVMIGSRILIPSGAWEAFIEANTVTVCQDVTRGHDCVGLQSENVSTSPGQNAAAAASNKFESCRARHLGTKLGTPKPAAFALDAATSVRSSTLLDPPPLCRLFGGPHLRHVRQIDRSQDAGAASAVPVVC